MFFVQKRSCPVDIVAFFASICGCRSVSFRWLLLRVWLTTVVTGDWKYGGRQSTTRSPATGSANWRKRQASKGEKAGAGRCWDRSGLLLWPVSTRVVRFSCVLSLLLHGRPAFSSSFSTLLCPTPRPRRRFFFVMLMLCFFCHALLCLDLHLL